MQSIRNRPLYIVANRWLATKNVGLFEMTYRLSLVGLRLFRPKAGWPVHWFVGIVHWCVHTCTHTSVGTYQLVGQCWSVLLLQSLLREDIPEKNLLQFGHRQNRLAIIMRNQLSILQGGLLMLGKNTKLVQLLILNLGGGGSFFLVLS